MNNYSILHLSDLHRISDENIDCLLSSFEIEKSKYAEEGISAPHFIVVSGDIVQGSKSDDAAKAKKEIQTQYVTASRFLLSMADMFLEGDRNRIIIVPGNHDVSQYVSKSCFANVEMPTAQKNTKEFNKEIRELCLKLQESDNLVRWSWKELCFKKVSNKDLYDTRFCDFIDFYNNFYSGDRTYPIEYDRQSQVIEFPMFNVTFVCLNSCYHLDHLNESGYISPKSLSLLTKELLQQKSKGRLIIAVWHHHTSGRPKESNYLDNSILDNIVENGVQLVLHGHQHVSGIVNCYKDVFTENKLWLVSAGTLYGNRSDVVTGNTRQYNILEVVEEDNKCSIKLRSRVDNTLLNETPVWVPENVGRSNEKQYPIEITPHAKTYNEEESNKRQLAEILQDVEVSGDFKTAINRLESLDTKKPEVRMFILDYAQRIDDTATILRYFTNPANTKEAIAVLDVIERTKDKKAFVSLIKSEYIQTCQDAIVRDLLANVKHLIKI